MTLLYLEFNKIDEIQDSNSIISESDLASSTNNDNINDEDVADDDNDSLNDEDLDRLDIANEIETMNFKSSNRLIPLNQMSFGGKISITNN